MIIDLDQELNKRDRPDNQFICKDDDDREMFAFCGSYRLDTGQSFVMNFFAYDFDDASKRVEAIKASFVLDGQMYSEHLTHYTQDVE